MNRGKIWEDKGIRGDSKEFEGILGEDSHGKTPGKDSDDDNDTTASEDEEEAAVAFDSM